MLESIEEIERQLCVAQAGELPSDLRNIVLADARRELRASRWDRRLARVAAVLLVVGVGMNLALGVRSSDSLNGKLVNARRIDSRPSLVETAAVVAKVTDGATARRITRQWAAISGRKLSDDEAAAIDEAVRTVAGLARGNKG